jgi:hypothetical protein
MGYDEGYERGARLSKADLLTDMKANSLSCKALHLLCASRRRAG